MSASLASMTGKHVDCCMHAHPSNPRDIAITTYCMYAITILASQSHSLHQHYSFYRAIVSCTGIQELRGQPPPPPNRHIHWNQAMHELTKYRDSIKEMRATLSEKDLEHFFGKQGQLANLKFPKVSSKHIDGNGGKKDQMERSVSPHPSTVSAYEPFSPQVVEVKVVVDPDSESRSSDHMYPAISSPDSEPELKIDCDYEPEPKRKKESKKPTHSVSPQPHKSEKNKGNFSGKKNYPTGLGLVVNKNKGGIHGPGVNFVKKAPSSDSPQRMVPTPTGFKPSKAAPGSMLTSLATVLAEKKRAEMNGFQDSPKKAKHAPAVVPPSKPLITEDMEGEEVSASLTSAFSRMYPPEKTAIAVVDPENKRIRKRKQLYTGTPDLQPSKRKPTQGNSPSKPQVSSSKSASSSVAHVRSNAQEMQSANLTFEDISAIWGETGGGTASEGASPSVVLEPETSSDSEPEDVAQEGKDCGLLETTIRHVYQAFTTKVKTIRGKSRSDMGYRYYSEKVSFTVIVVPKKYF